MALAGSTNSTVTVGPFKAEPDKAVMLALSGTWSGTVTVKRSIDGGVTKLPLSVGGQPWGVFSGNACEPVWEDSERDAQFYLDIVLNSGTLTYRMS